MPIKLSRLPNVFFQCLSLILLFAVSATQARLPTQMNGQALPSLAPILEQVTPAVVNINTKSVQYVRNRQSDFYSWFYGLPNTPREQVTQSLGSGVIVDAVQGYILTNHHVVNNADDISVVLADGRTYSAELIGSDEGTDVAVIQIQAKNLQALPLADSDRLRVGDFVVAVGNPFGLGQTVTSGIVSALGRTSLSGLNYQNFIQTDASINPGNSGGALIDLNGSLVGINTAIFSPSGGNVGIGFAIPSVLAERIMKQLIDYGSVRRGSLGVSVQDVTKQLAKALSIDKMRGALVSSVDKGSAAEKAGLQVGDVIIEINESPIINSLQFRNFEGLLELGVDNTINYIRNGKNRSLNLRITESDRNQINGSELHASLKGSSMINLPAKYRDRYSGVLMDEVERGSKAWSQGLRSGDLITSVDKQPVSNIKQLVEQVDNAQKKGAKEPSILNIFRNGRNYLLLLDD